MKPGAPLMPSHPPERSIREGQRWDLGDLQRLDTLGFEEAWIGEHLTAAWEPYPAPDLLVAQALLLTKRIRPGPLSHLLHVSYDATDEREAWDRSQQLLMHEVLPRCQEPDRAVSTGDRR